MVKHALVPLLVASTWAKTQDCLISGWGYTDSWHKDLNGGYVHNAETCQETCKGMWFCDVFTYHTDTKECFLQGNQAVESVMANVISGPKTCAATSLSEALRMVQASGVNGASRAQAGAEDLNGMTKSAVQTVLKNGVNLGLSNVQKAQVTAEVVGQVKVRSSNVDGNSVLPQIRMGAEAAALWVAGNYSKKVQAQQAMYAAGALAGDYSTAREETVQDRADYAVRMALDAADIVPGAGGLTTYEQLVLASEEAALVTARAGGTKKEVYTAVATAMHKVAELYGKPGDIQAEWSAIGEAAALDWYDQSLTKEVVDAKLEFKEILGASLSAAQTSQDNGGSLDEAILAAARAAQQSSAAKGYDPREQAREASIAGAEVARQLDGDLQERAEDAKRAAEKVAADLGFSQPTADQEGDRAKRLVLTEGQVGGNAEEIGSELGPSATLAASTASLAESGGLAAGVTAQAPPSAEASDAGGDGAALVAATGAGLAKRLDGLGNGKDGTALGSADSLDGEELGSDTATASASAPASGSGSGSAWKDNVLAQILAALACLLLVAACGVCLRSIMKSRHTVKKNKRKVALDAEEEDEEQRPLMASEAAADKAQPAAGAACQTGELPRIEINGGAGPAPGSSWNSGAYGGYVHYGGTLGPAGPCATVSGAIPCATYASAGRVPFATAPTLAVPVRTGSVAAPAATVAPGSASAVPISTTNGLPGEAAQIMTMSLSGGTSSASPAPTHAPLQLVPERQLGSGQIPAHATLFAAGHEVKQISYTEWHNAWQPGLPRDVVFTIPEGAVEGAALIVEVEPGVVVPTTVPAGAYPGALACLQR